MKMKNKGLTIKPITISNNNSRDYVKPEITELSYTIELGYVGSGRPGHGYGDPNHHHHHKNDDDF